MSYDTSVWRVVGHPLVEPPTSATDGPLAGESVAVKDLYAVAGHPIGAGNPAWLAQARPEGADADAVRRLLGAGASVTGITQTDEFAYSLSGTNSHYGTPPNPRATDAAGTPAIPGGSSSGSATAVALGEVSIGLGSDTGGSIRVPAAYQGLYGIRTTHDAVNRAGLLPLAPSFDTVGWLTDSAALLATVGGALLPPAQITTVTPDELIIGRSLTGLAEPDVTAAFQTTLDDWGAWRHVQLAIDRLDAWRAAFTVLQAYEAWQQHSPWLADRLDTLGVDVRDRFGFASTVTAREATAAAAQVSVARAEIIDLIGDQVLAIPAAATVAPRVGASADRVRAATMRLTCIAGIGGLPAVALPVRTADGLPCGVCLLAAPGRDRDLLDLAIRLPR